MTTRPIRKRLAAGETLIGTLVTLDSPTAADALARAGLDWLFIDLEHSPLGMETTQKMLQAAGAIPGLIRVPANEAIWITKALDCGADGVIVPQIRTAQEARQAVRMSKYPPLGERSVGVGRAHGYGFDFQDYVQRANADTALVLQIEHIEAVRNVDQIATVAGIDALFVGPYDLSGSMGKIGQVTDHQVQQAIDRVRDCCRERQIPMGIFGLTPEAVAAHIKDGVQLITIGIDVHFLGRAVSEMVAAAKSLTNV